MQIQPRSIGELLDDNFRLYREKFKFLTFSAICVFLPYNILDAYIKHHYHMPNLSDAFKPFRSNPLANPHPYSSVPNMAGSIWISVIALVFSLVLLPMLYGMIVHMLTEHYLNGKEVRLGEASKHALRRLFPLFLTSLVLLIIIVAAIAITFIIFTALFKLSPIAAGLLGGLAFIAFFFVIVWIGVRFSALASVIFEEKMMFRAIARTWVLTRRNFWRLLGYYLLLFIIVGILVDLAQFGVLFIPQIALQAILLTVVEALLYPLLYVGAANAYLDLRIRKDGLDLIES